MLDKGGLDKITTFGSLIEYLRDELDWPIEEMSFDDLTYEWDPREFGLKADEVAGQVEIKQLRPIEREPWGIFFLSLPHRKIPVTVLRRILGSLAPKKRASANPGGRAVWAKTDLLFIAAHGEGAERGLAFAHFHEDKSHGDLPTLKLLGWDGADTVRRLSATHDTLKKQLHWRDGGETDDAWRLRWNDAFREKAGEVVATSKAMAKELASLAREIRRRANELLVEENDQGPLRKLHTAFKEALIHDLEFDDFADMYAQTIAYGLLSARISRESGALVADNAADLAPPTNPFLKELLETFLQAGGRKGGMDFDELGVNDVIELLRRANMEAVLRDFDDRNPNEDPVIHFYELFLKEYDAQKRMQRGVFYTPRPVVGFIVRSVDEVLRDQFGLEDGLASTATWGEVIAAKPEIVLPEGAKASDPFVRILDPATGTGTFLVETIDLIWNQMRDKWRKAGKRDAEITALWNDYVPNHLLPRLYGFELMMAPYAIAHMKLGLKLHETGYRFGSDERARIYLTNALEPAQDFDMQLRFMSEALAHEAQAANAAKDVRFTVVVGNPPYAGHSTNNSIKSIVDKVHDYKRDWPDLLKPGQGKWLQDDYVKFIRLSQSCLDLTSTGVFGFITNNSWLDNPTFKGMRERILASFSFLRVIDLHGNYKRGRSPNGEKDENVFEDVAQGVAITIGRAEVSSDNREVGRTDILGTVEAKLEWLSGTVMSKATSTMFEVLAPENLFVILDAQSREEFRLFPSLREVINQYGDPAPGIVTTHDEFAVSFDRDEQIAKVRSLVASTDEARAREKFQLCTQDQWNYEAAKTRLASETWLQDIGPIGYRPFDARVSVFNSDVAVHLRNRATAHMRDFENVALVTTRQRSQDAGPWPNVFVSDLPIESTAISNKTKEINYIFPLWLKPNGSETRALPNIAPDFSARLAKLTGLTWDDCIDAPRQVELAGVLPTKPEQTAMFATRRERGDLVGSFGPRDVFDWIYAVLHSPAYRARYADYLKSDFARIPLPTSRELFQALVPLGTELVALHLLDSAAAPALKDPQAVRFAGHGEARVEQAGVWTPPSGGRVTISDHRWFEGVPARVWNFHIGGYQPAQKWLKDRAKKGGKKASPGRVLTAEDQLHYRRMIAAMDRTIDLMAEIDRVIDKHGGWPGAFKGTPNE